MRSGPTNKATREIIVDLEKHGKKTKKKVWIDISKRLAGPSRGRTAVNVYEINKLAGKNKGKVFVVLGKLLSKGDIEEKAEIACLSVSKKAKEKVAKAGGKVYSMKELVKMNPEAGKIMVVQ